MIVMIVLRAAPFTGDDCLSAIIRMFRIIEVSCKMMTIRMKHIVTLHGRTCSLPVVGVSARRVELLHSVRARRQR